MTHPEITDAAVRLLLERIGGSPARPGDKLFEIARDGLAAALPLLTAHQTMLLQANENHENYRAEQVARLRALNAALVDVARAAKTLAELSPVAYAPLDKALAHPLVVQAIK